MKIGLEGADDKLAYRSFEILSDPAFATSTTSYQFMENHLKDLSPRKHTIKLDLGVLNGGCELTLDWSNADVAKLEPEAKLASQGAYKNIVSKRQLNEYFANRCYFTDDAVFPSRTYEGSGNYGDMDMNFKKNNWVEINCANVK